MTENTAFTPAGADAVAQRNGAIALKQAVTTEGMRSASSANVANINNAGAEAREAEAREYATQHPAALPVAPGSTVMFAPGDPRYVAPAPDPATVQGDTPGPPLAPKAPTALGSTFTAPSRPFGTDQTRAQLIEQEIAAMPDGPEKQARIREITSPAVVIGENHDATKITTADIQADSRKKIVSAPAVPPQMEKALGDEVDRALALKGYALEPAAKSAVINRASQLFADGNSGSSFKNMPLSIEGALGELMQAGAQRTDSGLNPFSSPTYGLPSPQAGAPQGAPRTPAGAAFAPAPQAAPAAAVQGAPGAQGSLAHLTGNDQVDMQVYKQLPPGAQYYDPSGVLRTKGGA